MSTVDERIQTLDLVAHPEGGFYRETHRSDVVFPRTALAGYPADRVAVTSILFLLEAGQRSAWHRVRSEELWFFHEGDPLRLRIKAEHTDTASEMVVLGPGASFQAVVPPGWWQDAEALEGRAGYALVGCVVAPGFEFDDFELGP